MTQRFPVWEVTDTKVDDISHRIYAKVKEPLGKNSKIKVKGNSLNSGWKLIEQHWYWKGKEKCRIHHNRIHDDARLIKLIHARVRVPELEAKYAAQIKKKQQEET